MPPRIRQKIKGRLCLRPGRWAKPGFKGVRLRLVPRAPKSSLPTTARCFSSRACAGPQVAAPLPEEAAGNGLGGSGGCNMESRPRHGTVVSESAARQVLNSVRQTPTALGSTGSTAHPGPRGWQGRRRRGPWRRYGRMCGRTSALSSAPSSSPSPSAPTPLFFKQSPAHPPCFFACFMVFFMYGLKLKVYGDACRPHQGDVRCEEGETKTSFWGMGTHRHQCLQWGAKA